MADDRNGATGCGCAIIPGLLLGVVVYAAVGLVLGKAAASPVQSSGLRIALPAPYLARLVAESVKDERIAAWQVSVRPGEDIEMEAQVTVQAFGQTMVLPARFLFHAEAKNGHLVLKLKDAKLPGGQDATAASTMVAPLAAAADDLLQKEIARDLGGGWTLSGVSSGDGALVLELQPEGRP